MSRERFLSQVRQAAERGRAYRVPTQSLPDDIGYVGVDGDLCEAMAREVNAAGGEAYLVDNLAAAREVVLRLCREAKATQALCWQHELLDAMGLPGLLDNAGIARDDFPSLSKLAPEEQRTRTLAADVGITSCEWAIAETGTLMMWSRPGRERIASLLPPLHVAVVARQQILPDLYDAIGRLAEQGIDALPSNVVLITGPSKTGDMELELTTGVHGPGRWCVVIVRE
jgi:L-lactate dehydrogenase complex protein LldG